MVQQHLEHTRFPTTDRFLLFLYIHTHALLEKAHHLLLSQNKGKAIPQLDELCHFSKPASPEDPGGQQQQPFNINKQQPSASPLHTQHPRTICFIFGQGKCGNWVARRGKKPSSPSATLFSRHSSGSSQINFHSLL